MKWLISILNKSNESMNDESLIFISKLQRKLFWNEHSPASSSFLSLFNMIGVSVNLRVLNIGWVRFCFSPLLAEKNFLPRQLKCTLIQHGFPDCHWCLVCVPALCPRLKNRLFWYVASYWPVFSHVTDHVMKTIRNIIQWTIGHIRQFQPMTGRLSGAMKKNHLGRSAN